MGKLIPEKVLGYEFEPSEISYTPRDAALYALGIGFSEDPLDKEELNFTYEGAEKFKVFPTFGINFAFAFLPKLNQIPGLEFEPMLLLHGEHYFESFAPLLREAKIINKAVVSGVLDKGSGAVLVIDVEGIDEARGKLIFNQFKVFIRGLGGFGGSRGEKSENLNLPERPADLVEIQKTFPHQALLYRLSGDKNPLHVDPDRAAVGGFERPILHGLCTFGMSAKAIVKKFFNYDIGPLRSIEARFSSHVFPGETLQIDMWKDDDKIIFQTKSLDRNEIVLKNALLKFQ